jgi:hypothetical protein
MFMVAPNGRELLDVPLVDNRPVIQALIFAKESRQPHEQEFLWTELARAVKDLRAQANWLESEIRRHEKQEMLGE